MTRPSLLNVGIALAAALLIVPATLLAQGDPPPRGSAGESRPGGGGNSGGNSGGGGAVSRGDVGGGSSSSGGWNGGGSSSGGGSATSSGGGDASRRGQAVSRGSSRPDGSGGTEGRRYNTGGDNESRVLPWYSRSRDGRPVVGTAAGREDVGRPGGGYAGGGRPWDYGYGSGYGYYGNNLYYPTWYNGCRSMYGFGAFGIGSFYYDPGWWSYGGASYGSPCGGYGGSGYGLYGGYDPWNSGGGYWGGAGGGGGGYSRSYADAGMKLKVKPNNAQVFVDGYFAGEVDEFDGVFQRLPLASGEHKIEIRAPGYVPLTFDVSLEPYQVINYKGELKRQ